MLPYRGRPALVFAEPVHECIYRNIFRVKSIMALTKRHESIVAKMVRCFPVSAPPAADAIGLCVKPITRESVEELTTIMEREMDAAGKCMTPLDPALIMHPINDSLQDALSLRTRWGEEGCWPKGLTSNIKEEFIGRGLYAPQLVSFLRLFPREQLLVLSDEELQNDPVRTMARVFEHAGLQPHAVGGIASTDLERLIAEHWPTFENTGWRMHASYPPLPSTLRARMAAFYAPHNRRLAQLLHRDFHWDT